MKSSQALVFCILISSICSIGVTTLVADMNGEDPSLDDQMSMSTRLYKAQARIVEMQDQIDTLEQELSSRAGSDANDVVANARLIRSLQAKLADLEARGERAANVLAKGDIVDGKELSTLLDERVNAAVKVRDRQRRKQAFKRFTPMVRAGFMRGVKRTAKQLGLDEQQTKRLEAAVSTSFDNSMPNVAKMLDPETSKEQKDLAFAEIRRGMEDVEADAAGYLEPDQLDKFKDMNKKNIDGMDRMRKFMGGAGAGGLGLPGGMPGLPGSNSDNQGTQPKGL